MLIAFEGLDQSGKETQARRLADSLRADGRRVETLSFPDYSTPIGKEIGAALRASATSVRTSCSCSTSRTGTRRSRSMLEWL